MTPAEFAVSAAAAAPRSVPVRIAAVLGGALAVAALAQIAVPLPGTPVPMTLQPLGVLLVGGLLGPRLGAAALVLYLGLGAAGLPVFTPVGTPGLARLLGPTGGYLLAYPFAAALVGVLAARESWPALLAATAAGLIAIHAGGLAQLVILTGSAERAVALGTLPFLLGDLVKVALAALLLSRTRTWTRALR
jgi:biotin transport system substrate-specific component